MEEDEGMGLLVLRQGLAKVRGFSADGEEVTLAVLGPEALLGDMAVLADGRRTADVVALTDLQAVKLRASPFAVSCTVKWPWRSRWPGFRPIVCGHSTGASCCAAPMPPPDCWLPCWSWLSRATPAATPGPWCRRCPSGNWRRWPASPGNRLPLPQPAAASGNGVGWRRGLRIANLAPHRKRGLWH